MKLQDFLADGALKAANEMKEAYLNLPEDKRNWSASGDARSALDMVAEVALLNGDTADIVRTRSGLADFNVEVLNRRKAALYEDWLALQKTLSENTARVAEVIRAVPDDDLSIEVLMPWGAMTLTQLMEYPYWNAKYHEGQINFIASLLGSLK